MKNINRFIAGLFVAAALFTPAVSFASTLTQPQVSAIIGLLEAFGVDPAIIAEVQADLAPAPVQSATVTVTPTVEPIDSGSAAAPAPQAPTCELSTPVDQASVAKGRPVAFMQWSFTPGATATIRATDGRATFFGAQITAPDWHNQLPVEAYVNATTTFEMDVSLNGLAGNCTDTTFH